MSKDIEWFSRPSGVFGSSSQMEAPPLSPKSAVSPNDLVSTDGACATTGEGEGSGAPSGASFGLEATECAVVRALGTPSNTDIRAGEGGGRVVVLTYAGGLRPGIYRFTGGRLTDIERVAAPTPVKPTRKSRRHRA